MSFSDGEFAWTSFDMAIKKFTFRNVTGDKIHPTQKPIELYRWILKNYATCKYCNNTGSFYEDVVGDEGSRMLQTCEECECYHHKPKILDTHGGSMSIARACYDYGFEITLCEKDKDYFTGGVERFKKHISQQTLFKPQLL